MIDDLMRQAGLDAIADKESRAAAGQEMTSPEQDRYHAACYFAWLVRKAAFEEAANLYGEGDVAAPVGCSAWGEARQEGWIDGTKAYRDAIRRLDAGRGGNPEAQAICSRCKVDRFVSPCPDRNGCPMVGTAQAGRET